LWDAILPEQCLGLPAGLAEVDVLLDDPRFFEPFRPHFSARLGRPSIPMEWFLRLMFLRFRYRLGFETLCREVTDSIAWRRFCRIPLGVAVPHPSTVEKIADRCGRAAIDALNEALLAKAAEDKLIKIDRVRTDTTVVPANVAYPTDSGLLAKGVARLSVLVGRVNDAGLAARTGFRDRTRSMRRRAHAIAAWLRRRNEDAKEEVYALTAEMAKIAFAAAADAVAVARNARRTLARRGVAPTSSAWKLLAEIETLADIVETIAGQARVRISGQTPPGSTRLVSLHDVDARPIAKGRLGKPVEFGYKAQVTDNTDGIVVDHVIVKGNPPDAPMLAPAIARITARFGRVPRAVTADRGYGQARIDAQLERLGVKQIVIPRQGRPGAARQQLQRSARFTKLVKWRTGCEARAACLKRDWGWSRTLKDGEAGAAIWCGWGILAHNSVKIVRLAADQRSTRPPGSTPAAA
jgi:IS5 family transposase